jgi:hypothetical protein
MSLLPYLPRATLARPIITAREVWKSAQGSARRAALQLLHDVQTEALAHRANHKQLSLAPPLVIDKGTPPEFIPYLRLAWLIMWGER